MRDLVCLSTADLDAELWTNKQHLMSRIAATGARVLYVDSLGLRAPSASSQDIMRIARRLARWRPMAVPVAPGLFRDSPLVIPLQSSQIQAVNRTLMRWRLGRNCRYRNFNRPILWTYTPAALGMARPGRYAALVYHCVDDLAAYPGVDGPSFRRQEEALVQQADVCIGSSRPLVNSLRRLGARRTLYWPNPADVRQFGGLATVPRSSHLHRPQIGFIGAIQEHKVDIELVCSVAELRPDWDLRLVGPIGLGLRKSALAEVKWPNNVTLVGAIDRHELPEVMTKFDVGLIPYRINEYTRSVFPMKVFEYLAAGIGVVSTPLPALLGEVSYVEFAATPGDTVRAVEGILRADWERPQTRRDRHGYAQAHSWEARTLEAFELLASLP